jgi:serine phosphatase RsbU (regulator of sigma subunit)
VDILTTIAAQAAIAIENARLLEAVAQQERLRQELELARKIQQSLLPDPPNIPGLFIAGRCLQAQETGGDLYDFIPIDESHLGFAVGDVVGKGVPAALLMATVHSVLHAYAQGQSDPAAVLEAVNQVMYHDTHGKTSVTLCYCVLDMQAWTLAFASAGHLSPLLCGKHDEPVYLSGFPGLPLGIQADLRCATQVQPLLPDQAILLYTDGAVEARDAQRRLLGFEALQAIVAHQPGERLIDTVLECVMQFVGPVALQDDLTLVVVQRIE